MKEGDKLTVLVEDIDAQGKISLKPVGPEWEVPEGQESESEPRRERREPREPREPRGDRGPRRQGRRFRDSERGSSD